MTEQSDKPSVDLPERVVDVLMAEIGLSTYHPDGDLGPVLQAFAQAVKREVLARLPRLAALAGPLEQPQADETHPCWRGARESLVDELLGVMDQCKAAGMAAEVDIIKRAAVWIDPDAPIDQEPEQPQEPKSDKANLAQASGGDASKTALPACTTCGGKGYTATRYGGSGWGSGGPDGGVEYEPCDCGDLPRYGIVERLRNGGQGDLADIAAAMLDALQTIERQCGERLNAVSGNAALHGHTLYVIAKAAGGAREDGNGI